MIGGIFLRGQNWNDVTKKDGKIDKQNDRV